MAKELRYSNDSRQRMFKGVDKLAKAVMTTLGPRGRTVIIQKTFGSPLITKDGVTVAREIELPDPYENLGAQLIKEAAIRTNDLAGDGTTTATTLAYSLINQGLKKISEGFDPIEIKKGMEEATLRAQKHLQSFKMDVQDTKDIRHVATISANNDAELGGLLAEAFDHIGNDGIVTVEDSPNRQTFVSYSEGLEYDEGYATPFIINDPRGIVTYQNPRFLLIDSELNSFHIIVKILEKWTRDGCKYPFVIVATGFSNEVLTTIGQNVQGGKRPIACFKAPGFGEKKQVYLKDLAAALGASIFTQQEVGLQLAQFQEEHLGKAGSLKLTSNRTTIVDPKGDGEAFEKHVQELREMEAESTSGFEKELLQERLAKLAGGVAVVHVGASTEVELKEKKHRVEDALNATRAALEEGIVIGGGNTLLRVAKLLSQNIKNLGSPGFMAGYNAVVRGLREPFYQIAYNAGKSLEDIVEAVPIITKTGSTNMGWNALTDTFGDLYEEGVIDPIKVTRYALEHAASVAAIFMVVECAIIDQGNIRVVPNGSELMGEF